MKIIPAIDLMDGKVVRLFKGDPENKKIYSTNPLETAQKWQKAGADLLHIVDLDATLGRGNNFEIIKEISQNISIPIQIAGGLRDETIINTAQGFATRIVLGTLAFYDRQILEKIADKMDKKNIVISVDHRDGIITINGWKKSTGISLFDAIQDFLKLGFSEFLLTNVNRDGTLEGPDLEFLKKACEFPGTHIIASGGISSIEDIKKVRDVGAFGVILGKALYENLISIQEAKKI